MKTSARAVSFMLWLVACGGGSTPPPSSSPPATADAGVASGSAATSTSESPPPDAGVAGSSSADAGAAPSTPKPVAVEMKDECTPVGVEFEKRARPKLKECYAQGKKKDPNLEGTVKIKITVDIKGKIKSVKVIEKTLPDPVADCMLKVAKATPFPEVDKCYDSTLTIPMTFPTPK